jgi:hypothetical protein
LAIPRFILPLFLTNLREIGDIAFSRFAKRGYWPHGSGILLWFQNLQGRMIDFMECKFRPNGTGARYQTDARYVHFFIGLKKWAFSPL